jgi:hypothetical protein
MKMKIRTLAPWVLICCLAFVGRANADNFQISCVSPTCTFPSGGTSLVTTGTGPDTFNIGSPGASTTPNGIAELGVLVPNAPDNTISLTGGTGPDTLTDSALNFVSGGHLGTFLGGDESGLNDYDFGGFQNASLEAGVTANFFDVYTFSLGNFSSSGGGIKNLTIGNLPAGTVVVAWLESNGSVQQQTPLSESFVSTGTLNVNAAEPGVLTLLFATALFGGIGIPLRRR